MKKSKFPSMIARKKELEDGNRRLKKMDIDGKLKAEIAAEYLAQKLVDRLIAARWPKEVVAQHGISIRVAC